MRVATFCYCYVLLLLLVNNCELQWVVTSRYTSGNCYALRRNIIAGSDVTAADNKSTFVMRLNLGNSYEMSVTAGLKFQLPQRWVAAATSYFCGCMANGQARINLITSAISGRKQPKE